MVSGFAVSTSIAGFLGMTASASLSWHLLHAISANSVFALFGLHTVLHYKWIAGTASELFSSEGPMPATAPRIATAARPALNLQPVAPRRST